MNYYPFHIGDFNSATKFLSRLARGIYRDMLDLYYDKELPLPADTGKLFRKIGVTTPDEIEAATLVLEDHFELTAAGWVNKRCQHEIQLYHDGLEASSAGGKAAKKKREDAARVALEEQELARKATQATLDFIEEQFAHCAGTSPEQFEHGSRTVPEQFSHGSGTVRASANQNQNHNQNHNQKQNQPPAPPTLSEDRAGGATAVELSIALRKAGVQSQPANPQLIALSQQGVTVETALAACAEARKSKGAAEIKLGYLVGILQRWASEATAMRVSGATPPARASPIAGESAKDRARRATLEGLTGRRPHEQRPEFIDINPLA